MWYITNVKLLKYFNLTDKFLNISSNLPARDERAEIRLMWKFLDLAGHSRSKRLTLPSRRCFVKLSRISRHLAGQFCPKQSFSLKLFVIIYFKILWVKLQNFRYRDFYLWTIPREFEASKWPRPKLRYFPKNLIGRLGSCFATLTNPKRRSTVDYKPLQALILIYYRKF